MSQPTGHAGQGWTGPLGPLSRRSDCMIWNVVVIVNASMPAAASTPVYLAMTGAAALGHGAEVSLHPRPGILPAVHVVRHRVVLTAHRPGFRSRRCYQEVPGQRPNRRGTAAGPPSTRSQRMPGIVNDRSST